MTPPLAINGHAVTRLRLSIGYGGAWTADVETADAIELNGAATLTVAGATLSGTVTDAQTFGLATGARIVGGAGGWSKRLGAKSYHNDAGVKAHLVASDAAADAGETLASFKPGAERVGVDYARAYATAATVLEYAAGGASWHVDYAGATHVGDRASGTVPGDAYSLLALDTSGNVATLAVNDLAELVPGRALADERLGVANVLQDLELAVAPGQPLRATARLVSTSDAPRHGRLPQLVRALAARVSEGRLLGIYRYRVVAMRGDTRIDLQAVRAAAGLPDLLAVRQTPGVPGLTATLTTSAEVLVQFVEGDAAQPLVTHYSGPGGDGFVAVAMTLAGDASAPPAARQGDAVEVLLPPAQFTGTVGGAPYAGVVNWLLPKAKGQITGGSGKVKIG